MNENGVVAWVRDLMFLSKITSAASAVGVGVKCVREASALPAEQGRLLLVDLSLPGAIENAVLWKTADPVRQVIGFVSHTDADTISRAQQQGIEVMSKGQFAASIEQVLRR